MILTVSTNGILRWMGEFVAALNAGAESDPPLAIISRLRAAGVELPKELFMDIAFAGIMYVLPGHAQMLA